MASDQSCTITASYGGKSDTHSVIIKDVAAVLDHVTITGTTQVDENSGAQYTLTAYYSDGSNAKVTGSASWSDNSDYAAISSGGYLATSEVYSDQSCTITGIYGGRTDTHNVTIKNVDMCSYSISSSTIMPFPSNGGDGSINVTTSADDCNWTATVKEDVNWITITPDSSSGSGEGTVYYSVKNNPHSYRSATIMVAGESHEVTQDGK